MLPNRVASLFITFYSLQISWLVNQSGTRQTLALTRVVREILRAEGFGIPPLNWRL